MNAKSTKKRGFRITFRVVRFAARMVGLLCALLVFIFIFLRIYGVPKPILNEIVKRVNTAGIPINLDGLTLTLRGWQAQNVKYFSKHPDDLEPIFQAREVLFDRKRSFGSEDANEGWELVIEASDIRLNPSVEWGVSIPADSASRLVDSAKLTLGILEDRVEFNDGALTWMGVEFSVKGVLLKKPEGARGDDKASKQKMGRPQQDTVLPVYVSSEQFQAWEDRLKSISIAGGARMDISFLVDAADYSRSTVDFSVDARDLRVRDVGFDELEITGKYGFSEVELKQVRISKNNQSLSFAGTYHLQTKLIRARVHNSITSQRMLLLTPQRVLDVLVKAQLQFEALPQFTLELGPAEAGDLLNAVSGSFSIRDTSYCGLVVESARGMISRTNNLLNLTEVHATIEGQENRAEEVGSALHGGSMQGSAYWDADKAWFGVSVSGSMDPNLFLKPLAIVPVATNAIGRFTFPDAMPQISLELGSSYIDWHTFFIKVQGIGNQVRFHQGLCSSMQTSAYYTNAVLKLDPLSIMSGVDFLKGTASIEFLESKVNFDAQGTVSPRLIEELVYPKFNLFGKKIKTSGSTHVKARGSLDWKTMQGTDFQAEVDAEHLEIPIAALDHFSAKVTGSGPEVSVSNAAFEMYDGSGSGEFSIMIDPATPQMPYAVDVDLVDVGFKPCLDFVGLPCKERTKGLVSARADLKADMLEDFFESANGTGTVHLIQGELADMPLFVGFSKLMRKIVPGFKTFTITSLHSDFNMQNGDLYSDNASFEGDVFNAMVSGKYAQETGFDAMVHVHLLDNKGLQKVIRLITDPLFKLFELRLSGSIQDPVWKLHNFSADSRGSINDVEAE